MYDAPDGSTAVRKQWDSIYGNFIFANYHSSMAVDNDDGRREHARVRVQFLLTWVQWLLRHPPQRSSLQGNRRSLRRRIAEE
jgi:hypothetical protein